ncbi:MAG: enoyl-CoA hydratase/isomerase family protein [Nitrospinae bacterium]|nr:enoyl-CoA hydratase/isomerase family protein [Nitrospinota bacterium]
MRKYKNLYVELDAANIAWLYFDRADASANTLSAEVLEEFDLCLDYVENMKPSGLVILSAKKSGFIAGADVNEFVPIKDEATALTLIRRGQAVFTRLEKMPFPTVAAINGFCLGGGMELALACTYRVAREGEGTQLGLPEVKLGIHPGFGGTVRSTAVMGGPAALDMMLTGRAFNAKAAKKAGLVDMVVAERHLKNAARHLLKTRPPKRRPGGLMALADSALARPFLANAIGKKLAQKANPAHYPAPFALLDVWRKHAGNLERMMDAEARSVAKLITGATAQNLIRVFTLQEKMKAAGKKNAAKVAHLHVIGAGIMGGDIAAWSALRGIRVTLQDREAKFIAPAIKRANELFTKRLKEKRLVQAAMDRLIPDVKGSGAGRADLIIEAVFEEAEVKRALFKGLEPKARPDAVFATNTSSIPLEEIASALTSPERLVGIHFFNPVPQMQLVEVVNGAATAPEVFDRSLAYVLQIGKLPLAVKSSPGFLVNRVLMPYLLEGVILESEGVPVTAVDRAAVKFGMPMGPLLLADTVGLDICHHVTKIFSAHMPLTVPEKLEQLVKAGHLGKKSGKGFYDWRRGHPVSFDKRDSLLSESEITDRLIGRFVNECVACLREGVVANADQLDAGMVFGTGFAPFRGGPLKYAADAGAWELAERLKEFEAKYGGRFKPDAGWSSFTKDR